MRIAFQNVEALKPKAEPEVLIAAVEMREKAEQSAKACLWEAQIMEPLEENRGLAHQLVTFNVKKELPKDKETKDEISVSVAKVVNSTM